MKVFVGTMESGEADFPKCLEAINAQQGVIFEHFVVSKLPEQQAHQTLFSKWNSVKADFDLFLKIDGDTVLANHHVIKTYVELFEGNCRLTGVQAWLHDYMTNACIYGLTCLKNTVVVNSNPDKLYCDRVDTNHDQSMRGDELPQLINPAGFHCHYASEMQAFHYGIHRAKKNQNDIYLKILSAWQNNKTDRIRCLALMGFKLASQCDDFDYTSEQFKALYRRASTQCGLHLMDS